MIKDGTDHNFIKNDRGSTLVTVIVAIAFVTILTSIILGTTVVNVRMKGIDKQTKDDFYYAERSLNDIYTGLGQELAETAGKEYEKAFKKLGIEETNDEGTLVDYKLAEGAEKEFRRQFLRVSYTDLDGIDKDDLQAYVLASSKGVVEHVGEVQYQKKDGTKVTSPTNAYRLAIKDVRVYVEKNGFRSSITTDIIINVPTLDFLGTNAEVSDYGLIANEGLYIGGDAWITGNVYAGVHEDRRDEDGPFEEDNDKYARGSKVSGAYKGVFGGINIQDGTADFSGNYIVSKGDINLSGTDPKLKVYTPSAEGDANLANLWFNSLRTNKAASITALTTPVPNPLTEQPTIDLDANVFALNDLTLNADNSSVVIRGNYYGYNEGGLADLLGKKANRDDSDNSAIIVNGSNAYLDMKNVRNFVLMGKAYIDFTTDAETKSDVMDATPSLLQVVPTAESVALKTNQQLYLVPIDFLDGPNPIQTSADTYTFSMSIPDADLEKWFGYKFIDKSGFPASMHKSYKVIADGGNVFYDYLVFEDDNSYSWQPSASPITEPAGTVTADTDTEIYIRMKKSPTDYEVRKYTKTAVPVGTGGSISSKAMFFLKIMMSENGYEYAYKRKPEGKTSLRDYIDYKEESETQPSAYRLYERINRSMGYEYFDLEQCVVGDMAHSDNVNYYARNAVVNYQWATTDDPFNPGSTRKMIQSNVLNNTSGMLRYSEYPAGLYNRYRWLCTRLDVNESLPLDGNPGIPPDGLDGNSEWVVETEAPLCHFVKIDNIGSMTIDLTAPNAEGLKPGAYGTVIATTDTDFKIPGEVPSESIVGSKTFKGVVIVDGNITVAADTDIDGLLMATGTITLLGNNHINYNKGLIQSRIEKEMNIVRNTEGGTYKDYYLINYLSEDPDPSEGGTDPVLLYDVTPGSRIKRNRIEADYNDFMHYENWQKGER